MGEAPPVAIMLAGCNGAGKTTTAMTLFRESLRSVHFVNADTIAGASRTFATWLKGLKAAGYEYHLYFFWLRSADVAIARVAERVRAGGHDVPTETIRTRYDSGLRNFFTLYLPLATTWQLVDNNDVAEPSPIAEGRNDYSPVVHNVKLWEELKARYGR